MRNKYMFWFSICIGILIIVEMNYLSHAVRGIGNANAHPVIARAMALFSGDHPSDVVSLYKMGEIHHPTADSTVDSTGPSRDGDVIKAKLDNCQNHWIEYFSWIGPKMQPISIKNGRRSPLTLEMVPPAPKGRSRWTISPGATWKSWSHDGQHWRATDGNRCLFYITPGSEPLKMVVHSK